MIDLKKLEEELKILNENWSGYWNEPRKPERLESFYEELKNMHKKMPDLRFGQFMMNFLGYLQYSRKIDPFFPEDEDMLKYLREYMEERSIIRAPLKLDCPDEEDSENKKADV